MPWRIFSPTQAMGRPQAPAVTASFHSSRSWMAGARANGSEVASSRWSKSPAACSSIQAHSSSSTISRRPSSSTRPQRESITTSLVPPKSRR